MKIDRFITAIYFILISTLILYFVSRSSPYYVFNNWDDANTFLTIGKSFIRGQVLYRDVIDQKGCYLFLVYGLASLITDRNFFGVWILEIMAAAITAGSFASILRFWCSRTVSFLLAPMALVSMYASRSFYWGGSAEEFCMPFIALSLWLLCRMAASPVLSNRKLSAVFLFSGCCAGIVGNIKFTILGCFAAIFLFMIVVSFCRTHSLRKEVRQLLFYLLGVSITIIPWVVYFLIHQVLYEWYYNYIYVNVFQYSNFRQSISIVERMNTLAHILYWQFRTNTGYAVPSLLGIFLILFSGKKLLHLSWAMRLFPLVGFLLAFLGIYIGGQELPYYPLPLSIFCLAGYLILGSCLDRILHRLNILPVCAVVCFLAAAFLIRTQSLNIRFHQYRQEDLFQFHFAKVIQNAGTVHPTLINYDCLDQGLFTVADIYPTTPYFTNLNLSDKDTEQQQELISEGSTDFVLCRDSIPEQANKHYRIAASMFQKTDPISHQFYLLQKIIPE